MRLDTGVNAWHIYKDDTLVVQRLDIRIVDINAHDVAGGDAKRLDVVKRAARLLDIAIGNQLKPLILGEIYLVGDSRLWQDVGGEDVAPEEAIEQRALTGVEITYEGNLHVFVF